MLSCSASSARTIASKTPSRLATNGCSPSAQDPARRESDDVPLYGNAFRHDEILVAAGQNLVNESRAGRERWCQRSAAERAAGREGHGRERWRRFGPRVRAGFGLGFGRERGQRGLSL